MLWRESSGGGAPRSSFRVCPASLTLASRAAMASSLTARVPRRIFDMFTEDPSKGCSRDRVASACLIGLQVYSLVTLYTYLLGFIPGFAGLHMQLQLLVSTPLVVASIDVVTNQFVVKAARAVGILPKPPTKWGGAPVVVPPPSPHATESV